jgi:hypothetical protein
LNSSTIPANGLERELTGFVRISLGLFGLPVLAVGILLLVLGLHEGRASSMERLAAGVDVTYYVDVSKVVAGALIILVGLALTYAAARPQQRVRG